MLATLVLCMQISRLALLARDDRWEGSFEMRQNSGVSCLIYC